MNVVCDLEYVPGTNLNGMNKNTKQTEVCIMTGWNAAKNHKGKETTDVKWGLSKG